MCAGRDTDDYRVSDPVSADAGAQGGRDDLGEQQSTRVAMARVEGEITIQRQVEEVFDFVADERNEPRYNPRMLDAQLISDARIGLGARFRAELKTIRGTMPMMIEVTGFERPRRLASATHSSMMDTVGALTFQAASDGTRMRWSWDVRPRGFLRLVPWVVGFIGRRQERDTWGSLKRLLESGVPPASRGELDATAEAVGGAVVLVAYASAHGSTKGVAERIAARLGLAGARVDVRPLDEVDDLEAYDTVILGSSVYGQRWIPTATQFWRRNADVLAARSVWLFSVGSFGDTHRGIGQLMKKEPRDIGEIQAAIHPRGYRVFAGAIERHQWPLVSRMFFHAFGGRFADNRDWAQIEAWADSIAEGWLVGRQRPSGAGNGRTRR
jgi:menaquinone-dependent protoporphyrinogen oxidase